MFGLRAGTLCELIFGECDASGKRKGLGEIKLPFQLQDGLDGLNTGRRSVDALLVSRTDEYFMNKMRCPAFTSRDARKGLRLVF